MDHAQEREDSGQSMRYNIFAPRSRIQTSAKRSVPDSPANSLSGSISEPLHLEQIAPGDRLDQDMARLGNAAATTRPGYFAVNLPQSYLPPSGTMVQVPAVPAAARQCKRCLRGPSYHHGHSKDCPKGHYAKRLRTELAMASSAVSCRRCIIGPSHHKAHAANCPRSKYYQKVLKARDQRGHR